MICLLLLALAGLVVSSEEEYTSVKIGNQKTLNCKTEDEVKWTFSTNNTDEETPVVADDKVFKVDGSKLVILSVQEENLGVYRCSDDDDTLRTFEVGISFKLKKMAKSISIDEGASTDDDLKCSLHSSGQEVLFKWYSKLEDDSDAESPRTLICSKSSDADCSQAHIVAEALFDKRDKDAPVTPLAERSEITTGQEDGIPFSILKIKKAFKEDRKIYICQAVLKDSTKDIEDCIDSKECDEVETILRVKDPLAAVYPFIGIVAEVIVLCIIIFFCERRKSDEKEDYDDGQNGNVASNSSLRLKK
jgi:hypothetical protein